MTENTLIGRSPHEGRQFPRWAADDPQDPTTTGRNWLETAEYAAAIAVIFFSPMNFLRLPAFYFTLSDAFACVCLLLMLYNRTMPVRPLGSLWTAVWCGGLTVFILALLTSSLVNGDPLRGIVLILQYLFAYFLLLPIIVGRPLRQIATLCRVYVLSVVLMCLHGIYLIDIIGEKNTAFVSGSGRFTGFVERENECAAVIALGLSLLLWLVSVGRLPRVLLVVLVPIMFYGVMLTGSNTGLAAASYAVGIYLLATLSWFRAGTYVAGALAAIAVLTAHSRDLLPEVFQKRVLGALESGDLAQAGSFDHRLELIYEALGRANDTIFLGLGADQYEQNSFLLQPVHNVYLLLWTEGGILCIAGFLVMLLGGFGPAAAAFKSRGGSLYAICTFCSLSMFLLFINAFPHVYGRFWSVPILLAIAISVAFVQEKAPLPKAARLRQAAGGHIGYWG